MEREEKLLIFTKLVAQVSQLGFFQIAPARLYQDLWTLDNFFHISFRTLTCLEVSFFLKGSILQFLYVLRAQYLQFKEYLGF